MRYAALLLVTLLVGCVAADWPPPTPTVPSYVNLGIRAVDVAAHYPNEARRQVPPDKLYIGDSLGLYGPPDDLRQAGITVHRPVPWKDVYAFLAIVAPEWDASVLPADVDDSDKTIALGYNRNIKVHRIGPNKNITVTTYATLVAVDVYVDDAPPP
jgi:hypothetical protein